MKKMFFFLGIITLIGFNVYISGKSDSNLKIHLELQNVALADGEGGGDVKCYKFFTYSYDASVLKCQGCCYFSNHTANGGFDGVCPSGTYPDC